MVSIKLGGFTVVAPSTLVHLLFGTSVSVHPCVQRDDCVTTYVCHSLYAALHTQAEQMLLVCSIVSQAVLLLLIVRLLLP